MPPTSCGSRPRCWCSASAMTLVVLVGGIDLSVGSVVLASATLAGIVLAEGLPSGRRHADGRSASAPRSALVNARAGRGPADQPGDRHARHHDRRPRPQPRGARRATIPGSRSRGRSSTISRAARVLGIPLDALVALVAAVARSGSCCARTIIGRALHAVGDAPVAARLAGLRVQLAARAAPMSAAARLPAPPACWSRRAPG